MRYQGAVHEPPLICTQTTLQIRVYLGVCKIGSLPEGGFGANCSPTYQILVCNIPTNPNLSYSFIKFLRVVGNFFQKVPYTLFR